MLEIALIAGLIAIGFGVAILMVKRYSSEDPSLKKEDLEDIVSSVTKSVTSSILSELKLVLQTQGPVALVQRVKESSSEDLIKIDESVIPIDVEISKDTIELGKVTTEAVTTDSSIEESKNKLQRLKKGK